MASALGRWIFFPCQRVGDHGHVGRDAAFHRAFGARRRLRGRREGSSCGKRRYDESQVDLRKKRPVSRALCATQLLSLAGAAVVSGWVAVALPGAVREEASPGPAVVPVLPLPLDVVAPPAALPER